MGYRKIVGENCTDASIYDFPPLLTDYKIRYDFALYASLISLYLFLAMGIVCDEFFVPAIERLCYKWNIPYNIAGATFMAAGTSSPEFFVNVFATFITEGDIGVGAIVGSSVFNSLGVAACCGLTGVVMSLDWWPLTRDMIWYLLSSILMTVFILDNYVSWHESLILVSTYLCYVISLCFDDCLQRNLRNTENPNTCILPCFRPTGEVADFSGAADDDPLDSDNEAPYNLIKFPVEESCISKLLYIFSWPIQLIFFITIPNCRYSRFRSCYIVTMFCAIIWISALSYIVTWMLTVVGHNLLIPDSIMGITLLAICTSIPEIVSSIIVTRKGYGSMAICNGIGSNTFNILLCLGVPWLIKGVKKSVRIVSLALTYQSLSMIITGLLLYTVFMWTHFTLRLKVGLTCLMLYIIYISFAIAAEMNVFGVVNLPPCPHDYVH